ncbi:hypothetical protein RHSIM_Rhsim11G0138800 [Rhododendron simsii]|uniref:Thiolase N-terminal domain-containing protein n=1 Tax=Rhododendron simsii TaxID=118357 RepID=A0A834LBD8_RHOSS|nr:hypothetical protein RHSIM_Rhsim11G0138800 [Rhododendron simsii]
MASRPITHTASKFSLNFVVAPKSRSPNRRNRVAPKSRSPNRKDNAQAQDCLLPMGVTSENVAHRFSVTRQEQDQAAVDSHRKAAAAIASGKFKEEIIPVATKIVDPKTGDEKPVTISVDDGIQSNASLSDLGKLKPVFKKYGTTTAGNSSQVSDGAKAVLLMKRSVAMQKGLSIISVFRCELRLCCLDSIENRMILIRRYVALISMGDAIFLAVNIVANALNLISGINDLLFLLFVAIKVYGFGSRKSISSAKKYASSKENLRHEIAGLVHDYIFRKGELD